MGRDDGTELPPSYMPDDEFVPPPAWPKAIGIVSIVVASLNLGCMGCGMLSLVVMPMVMPPEAAKAMASMPSPFSPMYLASIVLGVGMALLLLVAGISTLTRKPLGRTLHLVYGVAAMPAFAYGVYVTVEQNLAMQQWAAQNPDNEMAKAMSQGAGSGSQLFTYAIMIAFGLLYPLFLLVWFGIVKRRAADMLGTQDAQSPAA